MHHNHLTYMRRALHLAQLGEGHVSPNPMVGAVLVHDGRIIGEGWHQAYGGPHAEVNCLASVAENERANISKSTLYVTLEPCNHFGKTPPCVDLVLKHKIQHVVIAHTDPNPLTAGKSVEKLRAAGVQVELGVGADEAQWLNRAFIHYINTGLPYVILKWAQTPDGMMGSSTERLQISGAATQRLVHKWRSQADAILVGKRTAQLDNPRLNLRHAVVQKPLLRIALCSASDLAPDAHLLDDSQPTWLFGNETMSDTQEWKNTRNLPKAEQEIPALLARLAAEKKAILLIEGGAEVLRAFIESGHWNEIRRITGSKTLDGADIAAPLLAPTTDSSVSTWRANFQSRFALGLDHIDIFTNAQK